MEFIKEYVVPVIGIVVFVLLMFVLLLAVLPIDNHGNIERERRAVVVEQCVEATPNDQKTIEHCMAKYSFIMGK